jgi:hypothetical protein
MVFAVVSTIALLIVITGAVFCARLKRGIEKSRVIMLFIIELKGA